MPEIGETFALSKGSPAKRTATGRSDIQQAVGRDWQNAYADFVTSLKERLSQIEDEKRREEALAQMRQVLDSYAKFRDGKSKRARTEKLQ